MKRVLPHVLWVAGLIVLAFTGLYLWILSAPHTDPSLNEVAARRVHFIVACLVAMITTLLTICGFVRAMRRR
jgi:hypothetical protein